MGLRSWLRRFRAEEEVDLVAQRDTVEVEALAISEKAIDELNRAMEILTPLRYSLWLDRTIKPHRLQLCSWDDCQPQIIYGGR